MLFRFVCLFASLESSLKIHTSVYMLYMRGATLYQYFFLDFFFISRVVHSPVHLLRKQELLLPLFLNPGKKKKKKK